LKGGLKINEKEAEYVPQEIEIKIQK